MATGDKDVNIHLRLFDDFSSAAQRIQTNVTKIGESLDRTGRQVQQFGSRLAFLGSAVTGAFLLSMKAVEDASPRVQRTMGELSNVMRNLQLSIAEAVVPAVQRMVDILASLVDAWNSLDPKMREQITQFIFLSGITLVAVGAFLKFSGIIISLVGKITTLVGWISKKNVAIFLTVVAIQQMIQHWEKVKQYVLPIVNALQWELSREAIIILELGRALIWVTDKALQPFIRAAASLIPILEHTKVISKETADRWRESLSGISDQFGDARAKMKQQIDQLKKDMKQAASDTGGTWATQLDEVLVTAEKMTNDFGKTVSTVVGAVTNGIENSTSRAKEAVINWAGLMRDTVQRVANAMSQSLGNFFYNVLTRQITSAKQAFVEFGQSVLRILSEVAAKLLLQLLLQKAISSAFGMPSFSFFHSGGQVKKAHSGTFAQDEVPIIAQEGEGVLSRQGMGALGRGNLNKLNRGEGIDGGGGGTPPVIVIQAWDVRDIQRNSKAIEKVIGDAMKRNSGLRGTMKQYG